MHGAGVGVIGYRHQGAHVINISAGQRLFHGLCPGVRRGKSYMHSAYIIFTTRTYVYNAHIHIIHDRGHANKSGFHRSNSWYFSKNLHGPSLIAGIIPVTLAPVRVY
jgi:hypothetical protein